MDIIKLQRGTESPLQKGKRNMKKCFLLISAALLSAAILTGCYAGAIDNPVFTEAPDGATVINEDTAKRAALGQAKLEGKDVVFNKIELDKDDGRNEYEIVFIYDGYKYEVEVDAADGSIKDFEKERLKTESSRTPDDGNGGNTVSSPDSLIGEEAALKAAFEKAGLVITKDQLEFVEIELDRDDGKYEYDIEFIYNGGKYEMSVDAVSAEVFDYEFEASGGKETSLPENRISKDEALQIALKHAKLSESDISRLHIKLENDDGRLEYEVEFIHGNSEYDYDIDAESGKIISFDRDAEHCSAPEASVPASSELIGEKAAENAAIKHAGVDPSKVYDVEVEYDYDDGEYKYEVEFKCGNIEYEYDIDAFTGKILRFEHDIDD